MRIFADAPTLRVCGVIAPAFGVALVGGWLVSRWWFGWFFATGFHAVRRVSQSGRKTGDMQETLENKGPERLFRPSNW